jgi:hypothetical protein
MNKKSVTLHFKIYKIMEKGIKNEPDTANRFEYDEKTGEAYK